MMQLFAMVLVAAGTIFGILLLHISSRTDSFATRCMGYHAADDPRLPETFICFDCKVKADPSWELIKVDLYPMMISKYKELALFRCALFLVRT